MIIFDVHDALLKALTGTIEHSTEGFVPVFDTQPFTDDIVTECIVVGGKWDSDESGETEGNWRGLRYGIREESGSVSVSVLVQNGEPEFAEKRKRCKELVDELLKIVSDDANLDMEASYQDPQITKTGMRYHSAQTGDGWFVEAILTVHFNGATEYRE